MFAVLYQFAYDTCYKLLVVLCVLFGAIYSGAKYFTVQ